MPLASSARAVTFRGFKHRVVSFRVAGVALCDSPTCVIRCRNAFCVASAMLLCRFQMVCIFRGRRSTLETCIKISRGKRSTSDVSCCVLLANRLVRAASSGDNMQIPWQARRFVRCDEIDGALRRNIDFEVANFGFMRKLVGKRRF